MFSSIYDLNVLANELLHLLGVAAPISQRCAKPRQVKAMSGTAID